MARLFFRALEMGGHQVTLASEFRAFAGSADISLNERQQQAAPEINRLRRDWASQGKPDLWFCYHPYYKAPDLLGPALCREFGVPYVTAESSYSYRRNQGEWAASQALVADGAELAVVNLCLTERDRRGLAEAVPSAQLERLDPFIATEEFYLIKPEPKAGELVTVAMMRPGDKLSSYAALAKALETLSDTDWRLTVVGDGPARAEVEALFAGFPPQRVRWRGQLSAQEVAKALSESWLYVWPGHGEAYGLAYLEAQAAGVPVVAEAVAGVPEVVMDGISGSLTPAGDTEAYAAAITRLLEDEASRHALAASARCFVLQDRSLQAASKRLNDILKARIGGGHE
ncbi:glycosyltransferase family 4 protein [Rhizobium oryzicola]